MAFNPDDYLTAIADARAAIQGGRTGSSTTEDLLRLAVGEVRDELSGVPADLHFEVSVHATALELVEPDRREAERAVREEQALKAWLEEVGDGNRPDPPTFTGALEKLRGFWGAIVGN